MPQSVLSVLNNPTIMQRLLLRRTAKQVLNDQDMERVVLSPLMQEMLAWGKSATEADAQSLQAGDHEPIAKKIAAGMVQNHGFAAGDVGSSPFTDIIVQIIQQALPLLLKCLGG